MSYARRQARKARRKTARYWRKLFAGDYSFWPLLPKQ